MLKVVSLLLPDTKVEGEEEREALRNAVLTNTAHLLDQMPRDVEFTYNRKMDKLKPLLVSSMVPYTDLLKNLHLPEAHFQEECSLVCPQKQICRRIRETMDLVHLIVGGLGERFNVFEGIKVSMIGSTREGSRVFFFDEIDLHLSLKENFKQFSFFDLKHHLPDCSRVRTCWNTLLFTMSTLYTVEFTVVFSTAITKISETQICVFFSQLFVTTNVSIYLKCSI